LVAERETPAAFLFYQEFENLRIISLFELMRRNRILYKVSRRYAAMSDMKGGAGEETAGFFF